MLTAIIAAIVTAALIVAIIVVVVAVRSRRNQSKTVRKREFSQLDNVAVSSLSTPQRPDAVDVSDEDIHVSDSLAEDALSKPSDSLTARFIGIGAVGIAIFGVLAARLYSMQILSNDEYVEEAENNLYTTVSIPAPRGCIYDTNGVALVVNKATQTVLADGDVSADSDVVRRLSVVLGVPANVISQRINDTSAGAQSQRVVATDVRLRDVAFITEHADAFSGVTTETRTVREYPYGALCAHVLGYTGSPTESMLEDVQEGRTIEMTDTVGLSGIESYYDNLLAGDRGQRRVAVDANGNVVNVVSEISSSKGNDIYLTIDATIQYLADSLLAETVAPTGVIGLGHGVAGALIALDVRDGSVIAMSSYPTFDPTNFTGSISNSIWDLYSSEAAHAPLTNRVVNGQYAAASTYKPFSAMAALNYGFATQGGTYWTCTGSWDGFGTGDVQFCWDHSGHGTLDLYGGIVNSCDVVFYELAKKFWENGSEGTGEISDTALQDYIARFNLGSATGIDVAGESTGRIPTPEWKAEQWRNVPSEATWRAGDYSNMIIGQGDVLVTPLQLAVAYGAIATGKLMRPHLLKEVRNDQGDVVLTVEPEEIKDFDVDMDDLEYVRSALRGVIAENTFLGPEFAAEGLEAAGKSGTAEHTVTADDAWFVAYAPYDDPQYLVACVIEQGGGGTAVASPIVSQVLGAIMRAHEGQTEGQTGEVHRIAGSTGQATVTNFISNTARTD